MALQQKLTKLYYSIGEVAGMYDVNQSLIRYWEKEFTILNPGKNRNGVRKYTKKDIEVFDRIFDLIKTKGLTIDGAKRALEHPEELTPTSTLDSIDTLVVKLESLQQRLQSLRNKI